MCETHFLGFESPLIPKVVRFLLEKKGVDLEQSSPEQKTDEPVNLSDLVCVLPSAFSVALLRRRLGEKSKSLGREFILPDMITTGGLAHRLLGDTVQNRVGQTQPESEKTLAEASDFEQTIAWARALMHSPADALVSLVPNPPPTDSVGPWLELASMIRRLHNDLAADLYRFRDVLLEAQTESDRNRWSFLCELHDRYLRELHQARLLDANVVHLDAVRLRRCESEKTMVLISTIDLSELQRSMLKIATDNVIALVGLPQERAEMVDEFGVVRTTAWVDHEIPLSEEQLVTASDIADQTVATADAVLDLMSFDQDSPLRMNQVTVGITDTSQVVPTEMQLRHVQRPASGTADIESGSPKSLRTHRYLGWTVEETGVGRLLALTTTYLRRRSWASLAALVRHADVHRLVTSTLKSSPELSADFAAATIGNRWLPQLDQLMSTHYPQSVRHPLPTIAAKKFPLAVATARCVESWLGGFDTNPDASPAGTNTGPTLPFAAWSERISRWLRDLYPGLDEFTSADPAIDGALMERRIKLSRTQLAAIATLQLVDQFRRLSARLDFQTNAPAAFELLASRIADLRFNAPPPSSAIKLLGWLDLVLDDSPGLILIGLNHPFVPESVTVDPYLPQGLRTRLRLAHNDRRFARDVYAFEQMTRTRERCRFIVGRTASDGTPTPPSRLIVTTKPEVVATRVSRLLGEQRPSGNSKHAWNQGPERTDIPIPILPPAPPAEVMSVTSFRDYLACPYRYYLRHVLRLKPIDDSARELAANQFGDLVHGAVEGFGESEMKDDGDPKRIEDGLIEHLHAYAERIYSDGVVMSVRLQIAQATERLRHVAKAQAKRVAQGWQTYAVEASVDEQTCDADGNPKDPAGIHVDEQWIGLRGRFDRIDYHPTLDQWAILDFKTHGHKPEKKHLKGRGEDTRWIDLQLPLYRMMIPFLGIDTDPKSVQLGYFNVSEKESETRINIAHFSESLLSEADALIFDCVRRIRKGDFAPTLQRVEFDDYGMILQTGLAASMMDSAGVESDTEVS